MFEVSMLTVPIDSTPSMSFLRNSFLYAFYMAEWTA